MAIPSTDASSVASQTEESGNQAVDLEIEIQPSASQEEEASHVRSAHLDAVILRGIFVVQSPSAPSARSSRERSVSVASTSGTVASLFGLWRVPSQPGKLPRYLRRNFRLKTCGLLSIQFAVIFGIMMMVESTRPWDQGVGSCFFVVSIWATATGVIVLYYSKDRYPMNYLLLVAVTLVTGVSWGMGSTVFPKSRLHEQLIAILAVTAIVATLASALLSLCSKLPDGQLVVLSLLIGWVIGSAGGIVFSHLVPIEPQWTLLASLIALVLVGVLLFEVGPMLVDCNPDDFLTVIVVMDCTLFLATPTVFLSVPWTAHIVFLSVPLFVLSACVQKRLPTERRRQDLQNADNADVDTQARADQLA